jgi:ABC-type uncharacterized transport system permease subunit
MGPEGGFIAGYDVLMDVARFVAIAIVVLGRWHPIGIALAGRLDPELIRIMVESQVYRRVVEEDWREF